MEQKINSENTVSISGDGNKVFILNFELLKRVTFFKFFIDLKKQFLIKKIRLELDEKYSPLSIEALNKQIDLLISYILNNKEFEISIVSSKYETELKKHSKNLEIKNFFLQQVSEKKEKLNVLSFCMKEFLSIAIEKRLFSIDALRLIAIGMIERLKLDGTFPQGSTRIQIFKASQDFSCDIYLTKSEVEMLNISLFELQFSGYDIYDLPWDVRLKKAFPAIIQEFFYRKLDIKDVEKYLYLKIGSG